MYALAILTVLAAPAPSPTVVHVGTHVVAMRNIDTRAQSFYADLYLWLRYSADEERGKIITDNLEPVNGKFESKDEVDRKLVNGEWYVCYRITGTFFFRQDLRRYPFDQQTLDIALENSRLQTDDLIFVDDRASYERSKEPEKFWGVNRELNIPEYELGGVVRRSVEAKYPTDFGDPDKPRGGSTYSRFIVEVTFVREYLSYAFKILIPLLIILAMAYLVFFLPPDQLDTAAAVSMTALLSCMAYNVAVAENMPEIGYLVLSDKFFIATYVLLFLTLAETFVTFVMHRRGNEKGAERLEKRARWVFPALVVLIFVYLRVSVSFV